MISRAKVGGLLNDDAHGQRRRRKANAASPGRTAQHLREQDNAMTQIDCLFEVARKLKEARTLGEACSDRALLYFIDMTIVHVCDLLTPRRGAQRRSGSHCEPRPNRRVNGGQGADAVIAAGSKLLPSLKAAFRLQRAAGPSSLVRRQAKRIVGQLVAAVLERDRRPASVQSQPIAHPRLAWASENSTPGRQRHGPLTAPLLTRKKRVACTCETPFGHKTVSLRVGDLRLPGTFEWLATRRSMSRSGSSPPS